LQKIFLPYKKEEIVLILQDRIDHFGAGKMVFDDAALQLVAARVDASSGDLRRAMEICRKVLEERLMGSLHDRGSRMDLLPKPTIEKENTYFVRFEHISTILKDLMGSPLVKLVRGLPNMQQILLCLVVRLCESVRSILFEDLRKVHLSHLEKISLPALSVTGFSDLLAALEENNLIRICYPEASRGMALGGASVILMGLRKTPHVPHAGCAISCDISRQEMMHTTSLNPLAKRIFS
jgi:cell division control protein 6